MEKSVRIGNSSGFWGDEPKAMERQVRLGKLDYLTADYLAEVSMSILAKQQAKNPDLGYVGDFIEHVKYSIDSLKKHFPKIVTNAGGNNPIACAQSLQMLFSQHGIKKKVMTVTGDNLMDKLSHLEKNNAFRNLETGEEFSNIKDSLVTANVYTSSEGIVKALDSGADVVICGRASDSALTIGPLVYEFEWKRDDWDRLAAGMVAGHILECGSQACGGNFTDWEMVPDWDEMGYPIIEMKSGGNFIVSKPEDTGGLINEWTVKEQLVYEIADPKRYMGPDVIANLTTMQVSDLAENQVSVSGVTGYPAPPTWKVSMAYRDGYKASGMVVIGGEHSISKASIVSNAFWNRIPFSFEKTTTNFIGADALGKSLEQDDSNEILLQLTAFDHDKQKLIDFGKEVAGMILAGPQGMAAFGGRPRPQEVMAYWPTLVNKQNLKVEIWSVNTSQKPENIAKITPYENESKVPESQKQKNHPTSSSLLTEGDGLKLVALKQLCLARSGDKGNSINLGVLARNKAIFKYLQAHLHEPVINTWFADICEGEIDRYELENLLAFNFVLHEALDGGGTRSGRLDPQGKMLASAFLAQKVFVPEELIQD